MSDKIKVLIVDDSALIRELLSNLLNSDPDIQVVGKASDAYFAVDKIKQTKPDVITLDIEMPKVNGLVFLENLMKSNPMPVIVISSLTDKGSATTVRALQLGAIDFVSKPKSDINSTFPELRDEILEKVKVAFSAREKFTKRKKTLKSFVGKKVSFSSRTSKIITIGASTGGVEAITALLKHMPDEIPPIVVVQHMPDKFILPFTKRLNNYFGFTVKIAEDNETLEKNKVYVSGGKSHLAIAENSKGYYLKYINGERVNNHRPSADILFESAAEIAGPKAIGIILTGMGKDGAKGIRKMKDAGAFTIAQSKESCIVYGMPGEAVKLGGIAVEIDIENMADTIAKKINN